MAFNSDADDEESEEFDLRPPCPELFDGPLPNFDILGVLGSGGMGKVYKARQPNLERIVAIKVLATLALDDEFLRSGERFQREATAMARLRHPNIVSLYHYGETDEGQVYFVMEYIEGADLTAYIRSADAEPRHILYWAVQVCSALQYAHENGIVHRDIKPSNLLIDGNGDVKIADFGLAKFSRHDGIEAETQLTRTDVVVGTPHYIAPELLEDPTAVSPACDLYSLGVTLYQALTGMLPRGMPSPPSQLVPGLDPRWDGILFRCLSGSPGERFSSAEELQDAFEELLVDSDLIPTASLRAPVQSSAAERSTVSRGWRKLVVGGISVGLIMAGSYFALKEWQSLPTGGEAVPPMLENGTRVPQPIPLRLTGPALPNVERILAVLEFSDDPVEEIRTEIAETSGDLVQIWEHPGGRGVSGLRNDGTLWSSPEESVADSPELADIVWLAPADKFTGALRGDGRGFIWNREGDLYPIKGAGSHVMIVASSNGEAILLGSDGEVRWSMPEDTKPAKLIPFIAEECVAIGGHGNLLAAMSRSGVLRVWRVPSGLQETPDLLLEREMKVEIRQKDRDPSPYPDRWIPVLSWAVIGPQGEILPFSDKDASGAPLPMLDVLNPGSFHFGDSINDGYSIRKEAAWEFSGKWGDGRIEALEDFTAGSVGLALTNNSAFALFPTTIDIAARFEEKEAKAEKKEEVPPVPEEMLERSWTSERVEIQTQGNAWDEKTTQVLLELIESDLTFLDQVLSGWGIEEIPQKILVRESTGDSRSSWESGLIFLAPARLNALRSKLEEKELEPSDIDFIPPVEAFRPIARKLRPSDSSAEFFGRTESHLAHFYRLFKMAWSEPESDGTQRGLDAWEDEKALLDSLVAGENYDPGTAMRDPETGREFFSGLLARLHDDCGGAPFLDRFLGSELKSFPDASEPQEGVDHFVIAASLAAEKNLSAFFQDEFAWPVSSRAIATLGQQFREPEPEPAESLSEFRTAPDDLLLAWSEAYESDILPYTLTHRAQLEELRSHYCAALEREILKHEEADRAAAATIFRVELERVGPGYGGPPAFHPVMHRGLDPVAQQAVRELDRNLGRTYRERLRAIATDASSAAGGKVTRALDELFRLQHLFTLEGKDPSAQWAFDRRYREVKIHSLESVYSPRVPLDFTLRYEELIRWAVEEGAAVDLVQPITPTQVQRYTVRSVADVQAGRFVWQRLKIVGIQRGAEAKPWSDIHLELAARCEDLKALECGCGEVRASTLVALAGLPDLETLSLSGAKIEATETAGLVALSEMKLEKLSLTGAEFPGATLSILAAGPIAGTLEELGLANTETVDILPLSNFRKLKRLDVTGCAVPQENIEQFNRARRDCLVVK